MPDIPLGIDLGTTYSAIAVAQSSLGGDHAAITHLIPIVNGLGTKSLLLPSWVAESPRGGGIAVGRPAREYRHAGRNAIGSEKSHLGRLDKP